jgi:hypothetical protein
MKVAPNFFSNGLGNASNKEIEEVSEDIARRIHSNFANDPEYKKKGPAKASTIRKKLYEMKAKEAPS